MLPVAARLRRRDEFLATLRAGRRRTGGRPALLVAHIDQAAVPAAPPEPARAGFVVSRAVGGAVVRNRVKRRLRHLVGARLERFPPGSRLVVRALPAAATATSGQLADALDSALEQNGPAPARGGSRR